jgi:BirA family biotin operon repressor/biotin-[acetyl-CoA-carboxylase] ligase
VTVLFLLSGLGLNINQTNFDNLPKSVIISGVCKVEFDKEQLLLILLKIKQNIDLVQQQSGGVMVKVQRNFQKKESNAV